MRRKKKRVLVGDQMMCNPIYQFDSVGEIRLCGWWRGFFRRYVR